MDVCMETFATLIKLMEFLKSANISPSYERMSSGTFYGSRHTSLCTMQVGANLQAITQNLRRLRAAFLLSRRFCNV